MHSKSVERLADIFKKSFSQVGPRQAKRMALALLGLDERRFQEMISAMKEARERVGRCALCHDLTETNPCAICSDSARDKSVIAVVENAQDVGVLEAARMFRGVYHVLHGTAETGLAGRNNPGAWTFRALMDRLESGGAREVVLVLDHDTEGELTGLYIAQEIRSRFPGIRLTRIGMGIPFGGEILYADAATLKRALAARTPVEAREELDTRDN